MRVVAGDLVAVAGKDSCFIAEIPQIKESMLRKMPENNSGKLGAVGAFECNGVRVTQIGHTPGYCPRDQHLAKDGTDTVGLLLASGGAMHVSHVGREVRLGTG